MLLLVLPGLTACDERSGTDPVASAPTNGPVIFQGAKIVQRAGMETDAGRQVLFGALVVENQGDEPATLQSAQLVGEVDSSAASVEEVRVRDLGEAPGGGDIVGATKWPNPEYEELWRTSVPIDDAELEPGHAAALMFIIEVNKTGDWYWPKSSLDYDVAGEQFSALTNFGFQVCPPAPAECSPLDTS